MEEELTNGQTELFSKVSSSKIIENMGSWFWWMDKLLKSDRF